MSTPPTHHPCNPVRGLLLILVYTMKYVALALLFSSSRLGMRSTPPIQSVSRKFRYYVVYTCPKENCILFPPIYS